MRQHFRGVIWPRDQNEDPKRYVIIGMLITDKPLEGFNDKYEIGLD